MRRRAKRDLLTLLGVVVVIVAIVAVNTYMRLDSLKDQYAKLRMALEEKHRGEGVTLVMWDTFRTTKGTFRSGPKFAEEVTSLDGKLVNICGFMLPIDQFREVTEFMLLPVPVTCYFCDSPPMRDVIEVRLNKPADMVNEPILVGGRLKLHQGAKSTFFYTIENAKWNEAVEDETLTEKKFGAEHRGHHTAGFQKMLQDKQEEELLPGQAPATAEEADLGLEDDRLPAITPSPGGHAPSIDRGELLPPQQEASGDSAE